MPYSSDAFKFYVTQLVTMQQPSRVLDIGPGEGKYGKVVREAWPAAHRVAFEIDESYVARFALRDLYHEVYVADAAELINHPRVRYDIVVIGDCIEHMKKSAGLDLLNFLVYRSGYICVIYPEAYVQDDWEGHAAEAHISTWSPHDFAGWDVVHKNWEGMHLFLIKGYQPSLIKIVE